MDNAMQQQNQVFTGLWLQASAGNPGRRVDRAKNGQGQRALKFKTRGFHKALILETNRRPGFNVRLCGFAEKPGLIDSNGIVTFANPVESETLDTLLSQIDRWAASYETLYGEAGMAITEQSDGGVETPARNSETPASTEHEELSQSGNGSGEDDEFPVAESADDWDRMDVGAVSGNQE